MIKVNQLRSLTRASIKMYFRNRTGLFFTMFIPVTLVVVFGLLSNSNGKGNLHLGVVDHANNQLSHGFIGATKKVDAFKVDMMDESSARDQLGKGKIDLEVVIPQQFGKAGPRGLQPSEIKTYYNQAKPQNGQTASLILGQIANGFNNQIVKAPQVISLKSEGVQTNNLGSIDFLLPGIIAMSIMQLGIFSVAFGFISYKTSGALRRLHATPTPATNFVVAQAITRLLVGMMQVILLVGLGIGFFHFHMAAVSLVNFLILALFGTLVFLAMGFCIAGWAKDENQAAPISNLIQFPQLFLSGIFFPRDTFPDWLKHVTDYLPLTFMSDAMRRVANEGASLWTVHNDILGLLLWGVVVYIVAIRVFRWE